ncbi:MAG: aminoglycoside phosphotransferase family protein [Clostridia bacterium]|nr:aminoglycoside phosphotransferase family protein [Clostridia bacterium]
MVKVEKIQPIPLKKDNAIEYAKKAIFEQMGQNAANVKYLGGGSFGMAFGAQFEDGNQVVVKFMRANDMLNKEVYDLKLLYNSSPMKFPKVLWERKADETIPVDCYAMDKIEGESAFMSYLARLLMSKRKKLAFAEVVTTALHEIHSRTNDKFGDTLNPDCDNWLDYYKPFAQAVMDKAQEMSQSNQLSSKIVDVMKEAWSKFDVIFAEYVKEACLIHGDLNLANIMVDKDFTVSGFIDPLNSAYADREYDLFQFDNLMGKRFSLRKTYIKKYGASNNCDVKCAFYGLWNEVYCYIKSGELVSFIMNPLVKNMKKQLKSL